MNSRCDCILGKDGGLIRVINRETDQRKLIKNTKALIQDISFALTPLQILLGCVDEEGNLSVYNIDDTPDSIVYPFSATGIIFLLLRKFSLMTINRTVAHYC